MYLRIGTAYKKTLLLAVLSLKSKISA